MTEAEIRATHPDWTDEQVAAEVAKQSQPAPTPQPAPSNTDAERDAAFARERRAREEAEKRATEAQKKLDEAERKKAEEDGQFKDLAEKEKARADKLEADSRAAEAKRNAERSATDLKFKDAGYALYLLQQDSVDLSDAAAVKTALTDLAANRKDLITGSTPPPSGGPAGGSNGDKPGLTREQLAGMSPQAIAKLDPEIVNKTLAG